MPLQLGLRAERVEFWCVRPAGTTHLLLVINPSTIGGVISLVVHRRVSIGGPVALGLVTPGEVKVGLRDGFAEGTRQVPPEEEIVEWLVPLVPLQLRLFAPLIELWRGEPVCNRANFLPVCSPSTRVFVVTLGMLIKAPVHVP